MFTGIIKVLGRVKENRGKRLWVKGALGVMPRGSSVAVNGVCLTVIGRGKGSLVFDVSPETLRLTNLGGLRAGDPVNLEADLLGKHVARFLAARSDATGPGGLTLAFLEEHGFA